MVYRLLNSLVSSRWSGTHCRRCGEVISTNDRFGLSENVCGPCRG